MHQFLVFMLFPLALPLRLSCSKCLVSSHNSLADAIVFQNRSSRAAHALSLSRQPFRVQFHNLHFVRFAFQPASTHPLHRPHWLLSPFYDYIITPAPSNRPHFFNNIAILSPFASSSLPSHPYFIEFSMCIFFIFSALASFTCHSPFLTATPPFTF